MASQALVVATRHSVADVAEEETVRNRGRKGWRELNIDFPARRQDLFDLLYGIKFERNDYSMYAYETNTNRIQSPKCSMSLLNTSNEFPTPPMTELLVNFIRESSKGVINSLMVLHRSKIEALEERQPTHHDISPHNLLVKPESSSSHVFEIPCLVGQQHANALGDYGAKKNFMKTSYAKQLGLVIDGRKKVSVALGSGQQVTTTGAVETWFRFKDEHKAYLLVFHLLPNCIHDVILGKRFLKATETFKSGANYLRRVVKRISSFTTPHFLYLGDSAPRFTGLLNGWRQEALADSGCKVPIMDEDYARFLGLRIQTDSQNRVRLRFADNSTAMTSGMSKGVSWTFGYDGSSHSHQLDFHILKNAPAAVILSDDFLFGTNAFSEFDCYLLDEDDEDDEDDEAYFLAIDLALDNVCTESLQSTTGFADYKLRSRKLKAEDRIAKLPVEQQQEARFAETLQSQQRIEQHHPSSQNPVPPSPSTVTITQQANSTAARPPRGIRRLWFKLKPKKIS